MKIGTWLEQKTEDALPGGCLSAVVLGFMALLLGLALVGVFALGYVSKAVYP